MIKNKDGSTRTPLYFPAVSAALGSYFLKPDSETWENPHVKNLNGVNFRYFNDGSVIGKHPYMLLSAAHYYKHDNIREKMGMGNDTMIFADSGGFQLMTGVLSEKDFSEEVAYNWCEKNSDIFPILDRPIRHYGAECFNDALDRTANAAKYYYERYEASQNKKIVLNVMSSRYWGPELDIWYDKVMRDYNFGHFAHGRHVGDMQHIIDVLFYLYNKGEFSSPRQKSTSYYHILGVSTTKAMLYIALLQRYLNEYDIDVQLLYDSSTPFRQISFGIMMTDPRVEGFRVYRVSNKFDYSNINSEFGLPGMSPICEKVKDVDGFLAPFKKVTYANKKDRPTPREFYIVFSLHNLYEMLNWKRKCDILVNNCWDQSLKSYLGTTEIRNWKTIKNCFEDPKKAHQILIDHRHPFVWSTKTKHTAHQDSHVAANLFDERVLGEIFEDDHDTSGMDIGLEKIMDDSSEELTFID